MPGIERDNSRDRESTLHNVHSWSELGRPSVPMWDSSDPERAPPPLPLNPSTQSPTTKANTSAGIAAAAKLIVEKARESAPISSYTRNSDCTPGASPERSLIKGAHHRRMQSYQTGNVRDLRNYIDNRSPERSPERPSSTNDINTFTKKDSREDLSPFEHSSTPTPTSRDVVKDAPPLRPTPRPGPRPLLGENTPPSATMLALQTMHVPDSLLNDVTNNPGTPTPMRTNLNFDFQNQLQNLTSIANNLQREMAQLSRRSKDNATDLISLKEATTQRDEDIRKSLRQLTSNIGNTQGLLGAAPQPAPLSRSVNGYSSVFDSKLLSSPPSAAKAYSIPRAASAHSFLDDTHIGSPSPYSVEGAASVAMLEKIIREMVTKEGQDRLQSSLAELLEKSRKENSEAAKKVEQLSEFIKEKSESRALVPLSNEFPRPDLSFESPGMRNKIRETGGKEGQMIGGDSELIKMMQRIKDSVTHSGGTASEIKGLVRDLRGEVLGMGRELGRKLEQIETSNVADRSGGNQQGSENTEEIQRVVEEGITELKEHLSGMMRQRAEENDDTFRQLATRSGPNEEGIFAIVKHALAEHGAELLKRDDMSEKPDLDRDCILDAVKEGLKDFEPNIELQQFGLERDEILAVLKEGLEDYRKNKPEPVPAIVDKGEIFEAMQEALKGFQAPLLHEQITQSKEEIIHNLRLILDEYKLSDGGRSMDDESTRAAVTEAVREGLANHGPAGPREFEISREDLFDAVKASMEGTAVPFGGFGEQVLQQLRELIDGMRDEFKQYSTANGRDTEQVLDAVKDGLESLRAEIESYVDRASDVTGKDEIVDTVKTGLEQLRGDVETIVAQSPGGGNQDIFDYIKSEFEQLHQAVASRDASRDMDEQRVHHTAEIIMAVKEAMEEMKASTGAPRGLEDEGVSEEMVEAMKEEFEQLKAAILNAHAHDKSELAETIQDSMGALHAKINGSDLAGMSSGTAEEIVHEIRAEFTHLKESFHSIVVDGDREAIVSAVRQSVEDLRTQLSSDHSDAANDALAAIKEELDRFRESLNSSIISGSENSRGLNDEALSNIRLALEEVKERVSQNSGAPIPVEMLEAIRGEFENLRGSIASSIHHANSNEEVLDAVRLGLDDLRSHMDKKLDNPDHTTAQHGELLDAMNDGLESLRADVVKALDKPLDMTLNNEILETLKNGLADLRADFEKITTGTTSTPIGGGEIVLADPNVAEQTRDIGSEPKAPETTSSGLDRHDFEDIEVLLTKLQIKMEVIDAAVQDLAKAKSQDMAPSLVVRDDVTSLECMLRELQDSIARVAEKSQATETEGLATKQDTNAIETLLLNTKAKLDEMLSTEASTNATKEHLDSVEAVVRITNESMDNVVDKLENITASKADVAVVEVLTQDLKTAVEELTSKLEPKTDAEAETLTKADLDVLGIICTEIKTIVTEMVPSDPETAVSKSDIERIELLISDFRESHEKLREGYEADIAVTAKAFDDRKQEFEETKAFVSDMRDELMAKLAEGESGIDTLGETLKAIEEKSSNASIDMGLQDLIEKVTQEFEKAHGSLKEIRDEHQLAADSSLEKQIEHRTVLETLIKEQLETYFDGLMSKYDDAQRAAEEQTKVMEERAATQEELTNNTKLMADDLKLSIDTLGSTLTNFCEAFPQTVDKMSEESKAVFTKMDDAMNKIDETQEGIRSEHSLTRGDVAQVLAAVGGIQSDLSEHNPRFMVAIKEIQALIERNHEDSRNASGTAADHTQAVRELQDQVRGLCGQSDDLKNNVIPGLMSLPALMASETKSEPEKFDDSALHEKLDVLVDLAREAAGNSEHLERLDQIHTQVATTAAEVSALAAQQAKQISEDHSTKEREAEELALLIERRKVQKEEAETDITVLQEEKISLQQAIEQLRAEKEALAAAKARLAADVSSLETAVHLRREELHEMDRKAETLERRMMEGVMNQSRMLLLAKTMKPPPPKKTAGRDLRTPSAASASSAQTVTSSVLPLKNAQALALKSRGLQRSGFTGNKAERRIMSLNQINHNVPTGASAFSTNPSLTFSGPQGLKRSHSVKTQSLRKQSLKRQSLGEHDKENHTLDEESDEELEDHDLDSNAGTERRESHFSETSDAHEDRRTSYANSIISYETSSYLPGSEIDHRGSFGGSAVGLQSVINEEPEEGEDQECDEDVYEDVDGGDSENVPRQLEYHSIHEADKHDRYWTAPSDSGVGTDLGTAAFDSTVGE